MKLSFTTLGCPEWTLEQIATNARSNGYDGVELRTHADGNHLSPDASPDEARRVADLFRAHGVPVMSVMGYTKFAFLDPAEVQRNQELMRKLIAIAAAMGARYIRTFAGKLPDGTTHAQMIDVVADALRPLAREAATKGVTIGMETHDDWCASHVSLQLVEKIRSRKGFGIIYDVCNCLYAGIEPWRTTYRKLKPHILYCHVKDGWRDAAGTFQYAALGAGDQPWREVLQALKKDRFKGFLSFEWERKWHPELEPPERVFPQYVHKVRSLWG
ncbi:MAG: sugar phosphate isomerase/epimerase [Planctomycetes bacterium]|nr:sugar phosphate isomerase/epimerase [Planctomycetota bacterium]